MLLSLPGAPLALISVPIPREAVEKEVRALRDQLERPGTRRYLTHARQLYDWLIRPLKESLEASGVSTLVFVPDGPLLTIPMASLHDGNRFLVEEYAPRNGYSSTFDCSLVRTGTEIFVSKYGNCSP